MATRFWLALVGSFGLLACASAPCVNQTPDGADCALDGGPNGRNDRIAACTRAIQSGAYEGALLAQLLLTRGQLNFQENNNLAAIEDFGAAISLDQTQAIAFNARGMALGDTGRWDAAVQDFDDVVRLEPDWWDGYNNRARARFVLDQREGALADLDRALTLAPDCVQCLLNRGLTRYDAKEYLLALEDFSQALMLEPSGLAYFYRGNIFSAQHQFAAAIDEYDLAERFGYSRQKVLLERCWSRALWGQYLDLALAECDAALAAAPNDEFALNARALVNFKLHQFASAEADYDGSFVHAEAIGADSLYGRGLARIALGRELEGRADVEAARGMDPTVVEEYRERGLIP